MAQRYCFHASVVAMTAALFAAQASAQTTGAQTMETPPAQEQNQIAPASDGQQDSVRLAGRPPCDGPECLQRPSIPGSPAMAANPGGSVPSEDVVAPPGKKNTAVTVEALPAPTAQ